MSFFTPEPVRYYLASPSSNPLTRILAAVLAVLALIGAVFFGMVVLAVALGLGVLLWLLLSLRMWWLRRQWSAESPSAPRAGMPGQPGGAERHDGDVIDADYEVISRKADD